MNKEHLQDILNQTRSLNHMEYSKAERLKKKAASALGSYSIERISFTSQFGFTSPDFERQTFYRAKDELESILEANIEALEKKEAEINRQKELLTARPGTLAGQITEEKGQNKDLDKRIEELTSELSAKKGELVGAVNEIEELKKRIQSTRKLRFVKDFTIAFLLIGGGFTAGAFSIGLKIDYDKRKLQEKVDIQSDSLKQLNKEIFLLKKDIGKGKE